MGTTTFRRPPRLPAPEYPSGEVVLETPPELAQPGRNWARMMMMLPMLAGAAAMMLMFAGNRSGPLAYVTGGLFGVAALGMVVAMLSMSGSGATKGQMIAERRKFLANLGHRRRAVRRTITRQRTAQHYHYPNPDRLWSIAASPRLWERRPGDADFATARLGLGPAELATPLVPPDAGPVDDLDPMSAVALRRFLHAYGVVPQLPVVIALDGYARIHIRGDPERCRGLVRALLCHTATFHAPDDLRVAVCAGVQERPSWEWVKWLPHALHGQRSDALGQLRLVSPSVPGVEAMLDDLLSGRQRFAGRPSAPAAGPHLLVVIDNGSTAGSDHLLAEGGVEGVTTVWLGDAEAPARPLDPHTVVLEVAADGTLRTVTVDGGAEAGKADLVPAPVAEALATQLAPVRLPQAEASERRLASDMGLTGLLKLGDPYQFDPAHTWLPRANRDRLRVPFGVGRDGAPVLLDLKESAQDGMGPHGLLVGATGSGKSELLRTLVLALATTHDPELLNFVLIDFKGGATFAKLDALPHTSAVITNLADELSLVDRMAQAFTGELTRRQELLRRSGDFASARDYERARSSGAALAPLPSLFVVCDEFSELLSAKPDFIDIFVQIGRVGRSLGIHLLLASQRLEEGRLRGLDTHLSYRIGLRTFSANESRVVLGDAAAYELPRTPGHGYLRFATDPLRRFRAAYVSGTHRPAGSADGPEAPEVLMYTSQYVAPVERTVPAPAPEPATDESNGESLLDILVDRMRGWGTPAHQVWLPPLRDPTPLDALLPPPQVVPGRGLTVLPEAERRGLRAPIALVDRPLHQRRDPLWLDLATGSGHLAVIGGPQSGKSMLLRTVLASLALHYTPAEVQFYCLDFGGGGLLGLRDLPHVGGVATRLDHGQVRRTVAEMGQLLAAREAAFAAHGIDSMSTYRRMQAAGGQGFTADVTEDRFGDTFLVVDGWQILRAEFEDLEASVTDLGNRGLSYGIHLLVTAPRWLDLRPALRDVFGNRLELRLGEPGDSMIDRRTAVTVPDQAPGRGITTDRLHFLAALPRIDGSADPDTVADGIEDLVTRVRGGWSGPPAPKVRLLPGTLPYEELPAPAGSAPGRIPIGIAETDLQPVTIDFDRDPHFVVFGDSGCGKTGFLRALLRAITEQYPPKEAKVLLVDYRRTLLGASDGEHVLGYGTSAAAVRPMIDEAVTVMRERLPGPHVTAEQLRDRSWWRGPALYVLVDDYDLVAPGGGVPNPLAPLAEFAGQAADIDLHIVLARRTGGAARSAYEPLLQRVRELGSPGIVMDGKREEGAVLGTVRPGQQPPGRGWMVDREHGTRLIQLGWLPPAPEDGGTIR